MSLVKRMLRHVAWTVDYGLKYSRSVKQLSQFHIENVNADWNEYKETRKSASGWIVAINGTLFARRTRKKNHRDIIW